MWLPPRTASLGPAGLADHQFRLEDNLAVLVCRPAERLVYQQLGGRPAELMAGLAHRGQRDRGRRRKVDVVVTHQGDAFWNPDPASRHFLEHTEREQIVRAKDGSRPGSRRQIRECCASLLPGRHIQGRSFHNMQARPGAVGAFQRPEGTIAAVSHLPDAHRSSDERDPLVARIQQM
jgi:hypothetical protein